MSEPRARKRVQLACEPCRASKLKCDRGLPICQQCFKRSRDDTCKYTEEGLRHIAAARNAQALKDKIDRLGSLVARLADGNKPSVGNASKTATGPTTPATPTYSSGSGDASDGTGAAAQSSKSSALPSTLESMKLLSYDETHYLGPSHWQSILDDIADVKSFFDAQSLGELSEQDNELEDTRIDVGLAGILQLNGSQKATTTDLISQLPPKADVDRFVAAWFNTMDTGRVVVHGPTFQTQYQQFWAGAQDVSIAWLALLFSIASLGAEITGKSGKDDMTLRQADNLRLVAGQALGSVGHARIEPFMIPALIHYGRSLLYRYNETLPLIWHTAGFAMRLCYQWGYHRDPSHDPNNTPFDCEMKRRVWMVTCEQEISISYIMGVFIGIDHRISDTRSPSNLNDSDFTSGYVPPSRPWQEYSLMQTLAYYHKITVIFGDVIISAHTTGLPDVDEARLLHQRLVETRESLPPSLQMIPLDQCLLETPSQTISRFRLESLHQKALCVLYRRFLGKPEYAQEEAACLQAACAIVYHQSIILEAVQPGGQLATSTFALARHVHDFSLAAMLLCLRLSPDSSSDLVGGFAPQQLRALILRICALWKPSTVASPKIKSLLRSIEKFLTGESRSPSVEQSPGHNMPLAVWKTESKMGGVDTAAVSQFAPMGADEHLFSMPSPGGMFMDLSQLEKDPLFEHLFNTDEVFLEDPI